MKYLKYTWIKNEKNKIILILLLNPKMMTLNTDEKN